ncbi:MAG TPA: DUF748 domain-containing protein [Burkholderiaceae bacterium]|nr:DUF748 domain-containing protein [Burkholderiaceae bacterium]
MSEPVAVPAPSTPARSRGRRLLAWAVALLIALALLAVIGLRLAVHELHQQVRAALGPRSEVGEIVVGWHAIEVRQLRIRADRQGRGAWPTEDELRAERVVVVPQLRSLLSGEVRIQRVVIEDGYVSLLRTRDGRLRVLPALLERPKDKAGSADESAPMPPIHIAEVSLEGGALEFYDASVRRPALKLRLEQLATTVGPLDLPRLDTPTRIRLDGVLKGVQRDGRVRLEGEATFATREVKLRADLRGVDLVALQPYLLKVAETGVKRGSLDLRLDATVRNERLRAPGHLTLTGLELSNSGGVLGTFAGVPRQAVLAAMSRNGRIDLDFTLEGRLDDPSFSLNESFATKVASGLAESLGVSVGGVVQGVGDVIKGLFGR